MIRGPEVGQFFRASLRELEGKLARLPTSLERGEAELARLEQERERLFTGLAELYLPELGQEAVDGLRSRLPEIHRRLAAVLHDKQQEQQRLAAELDENAARRGRLETELDDLTGSIEELALERDQLSERVTQALGANPQYAELATTVEQAETRHEQSERRHTAAIEERDEKLPEYEQNRLFSYLLERRYGTSEYRASGLVRRLDDWVAGQVDFTRQLQHYTLLKETPVVTQGALESSEQELGSRRSQLQVMEKEIEDLYGLTRIVEKGNMLYEQRQQLVDRIRQVDAALQEARARAEQIEASRGGYRDEARRELAELLRSRTVQQLQKLATSTATGRDDDFTRRLEDWEREWASARQRVEALREDERATAGRLDGLRKIDRRFRGSDFDASNSTFGSGFDAGTLVQGFLAGALTLQALWKRVVSSQRFEPTRYEKVAPIVETILWEVARAAAQGGWGGGGRRGSGRRRRTSGGFGGRGSSRTTGGFGSFGGGSRSTGGFG